MKSTSFSIRCGLFVPVDEGSYLESTDRAYFEEHYTKSEIRIPMRDGVHLYTAAYVPKSESASSPIWLRRTPFGLKPYGADCFPEPAGPIKYYGREPFIFVEQDVRGRYASEGAFIHMRPQVARDTPGPTDESTDAYDTIEWLVKNIPCNGRVGISGSSYRGFYALCAALSNHPALVAVCAQAPIIDWFLGDDFHRGGAFYLAHAFATAWFLDQQRPDPIRDAPLPFEYGTLDGFDFFLRLGPLGNVDRTHFKGQIGIWNDLMQHGSYDAFWRSRSLHGRLSNVHASVLVVGGWFDADNLFGPLAAYRDLERENPGTRNRIVVGPWAHNDWERNDGEALGEVRFGDKTAEHFRQAIELPFFRHYLKDSAALDLPKASMFETGTNRWRKHEEWPPADTVARRLFLNDGGRLLDSAPIESGAFDEFISDPDKPVPYTAVSSPSVSREYMCEDQRFAASRPDVLVYQTEALEMDQTVAGQINVMLHVASSVTDSDWIVKLIDVDPSGYQQLIRGAPLRGKFRSSLEQPQPVEAGSITPLQWQLLDIYHTFQSGHSVMVHIQCTWFPLIDRNPHKFCDIYAATETDFGTATQRVYRSPASPSYLDLPIL